MDSNKKIWIVLKSPDERYYAKKIGRIYYYYFPEEIYNKYMEQVKKQEERGKLPAPDAPLFDEDHRVDYVVDDEDYYEEHDEAYELETDTVIEFVNNAIRGNAGSTHARDGIIIDSYAIPNKPKRDIKNKPSNKKQEYTGNIAERVKAFIAASIIALGMIAAVRTVEKYIEHHELYEQISTQLDAEGMDNEAIRDEIENILKQEISKATDTPVGDISFNASQERTRVQAGAESYVYSEDRDVSNDTLKSNGITDIIEAANAAGDDRRKLIDVLIKAMQFSENKDLEVEGDTLEEVNAPEEVEEER